MKKVLFLLVATIITFNANASFGATTTTTTSTAQTIVNDLKDAIVNDVKSSVTTNVNSVKLASYKTQLEQKQKELAEVEESSSFALVKYYKKYTLTNKISELEANIKAIEEASN
jgi:hypothetical protein